jgi:hypothetical protein
MAQTEVAPRTETAPAVQTTAQAAATPRTAAGEGGTAAPAVVVKQPHSFATFSGLLTFLIVLVLFCYGFFHVRRQRSMKQIDEKAGDEGED